MDSVEDLMVFSCFMPEGPQHSPGSGLMTLTWSENSPADRFNRRNRNFFSTRFSFQEELVSTTAISPAVSP
jgi:hypothetical protein